MRKKIVLLIVILSLVSIIRVNATTLNHLNHYDNTLENSKLFPVLQNVILNTTTKKMYLNNSINEYDLNIDCTTFIKEGILTTVTPTTIRHQYDNLADEDRIYKDYGVGYWIKDRELRINYTIKHTGTNIYKWAVPISLSNQLNGWNDDTGRFIMVRVDYGNPEYQYMIQVGERNGLTWTHYTTNCMINTLSINTNYYCTFYINDTYVVNDVYSDSSRTTLIKHLFMLLNDGDYSYRYLYLARSESRGSGDTNPTDEYSSYYNMKYKYEGISEKGYIYSKNLLENETLKAYSSLINTTIGIDGNVKVSFSDDNVTWTQKLYLTSTGIDYTKLESYNYTSLYTKFELTSNKIDNVFINEFIFNCLHNDTINNITNITYVNPPQSTIDLSNMMYVLVILIILVVAIIVIKR